MATTNQDRIEFSSAGAVRKNRRVIDAIEAELRERTTEEIAEGRRELMRQMCAPKAEEF